MREKKNQFIKTDPKNETDDRMGRHGNSYNIFKRLEEKTGHFK